MMYDTEDLEQKNGSSISGEHPGALNSPGEVCIHQIRRTLYLALCLRVNLAAVSLLGSAGGHRVRRDTGAERGVPFCEGAG